MIASHPEGTIASERRTSLGLYVTAREAYDLWQAGPEGIRILDCRTPEEYVFVGHPPMAVNIPFAFQSFEWDTERKGFHWELNSDFVAAVRRWAEPDEIILVACRSGGRAAKAVDLLASNAGYTKAFNILDGMEGAKVRDPESVFDGMRMKNGWKNSGLPWTYEIDPTRMILPQRPSEGLLPGNEHD